MKKFHHIYTLEEIDYNPFSRYLLNEGRSNANKLTICYIQISFKFYELNISN